MASGVSYEAVPEHAPIAFSRILCAVTDSRLSRQAAHQAAALAVPGSSLKFLAVTGVRRSGAAVQGRVTERRALAATQAASIEALQAGVPAVTAVVASVDLWQAVRAEAACADVLVLGAHRQPRLAGIFLGTAAAQALHASPIPVLLARERPELSFPGLVLVGIRDAGDLNTVRVAATIAGRHGSTVVLAHAGTSDESVGPALDEQAAAVLEITGTKPVICTVKGAPADRLPAMAESMGAGLVVLGSRGLTGARALASVSERVGHRAPCSVLVLR